MQLQVKKSLNMNKEQMSIKFVNAWKKTYQIIKIYFKIFMYFIECCISS